MKGEACDAVILGCTEIPLIMNDANSPLPTLDSTGLLARAALRRAVGTSRPAGGETAARVPSTLHSAAMLSARMRCRISNMPSPLRAASMALAGLLVIVTATSRRTARRNLLRVDHCPKPEVTTRIVASAQALLNTLDDAGQSQSAVSVRRPAEGAVCPIFQARCFSGPGLRLGPNSQAPAAIRGA
jgi:hypothetical protein